MISIKELSIKNAPTNKLTVTPVIAIMIHCLLPNIFATFPESAPTVAAKTKDGISSNEIVSSLILKIFPKRNGNKKI
ncbi:hypothetical protein D3C71_1792390 [compost metagenome]